MGGYLSRLAHRLTADVAQLDATELATSAADAGAMSVRDCQRGLPAELIGRLRSVEMCSASDTPSIRAEFFDGTDSVTLVWIGRRRIAGIETGRALKVRGRIAEDNGRKLMYNPYYELQCTAS